MECLLDECYDGPVVLYDDDGSPVNFEQVAVVPYQGELYAILKPMESIEGIADDEAMLFRFEEDDDGAYLHNIDDAVTVDGVFTKYQSLLNGHIAVKR